MARKSRAHRRGLRVIPFLPNSLHVVLRFLPRPALLENWTRNSLSLSALSSVTFLIKRPLRTVSSPPREKYQNSGSPSWFDRSNKFSSKSSRPTCDTELVVAVTAIARGVSKLSRYFALIHPRAAPRSSKQEHRSPRSLNGVLFL